MPMRDQDILTLLVEKLGVPPRNVEFDQQNRLLLLDLSRLNFSYLPSEIGYLTNLQELYLNSNQLTQIPGELGQLTNLQELYLNSNQLTQIPGELGQLTNLQTLRLDYNQLTQVPGELGQLTNLQRLDLDSNQLTQFPIELVRLTNLQTLYINNNQLTQVPAELSQLTSLQWFDLNNNQLTQIPEELGQLTNLQTLYLNSNQLAEVPAELSQLTNLQRLDLNSNQLTQFPIELSRLINLQALYLSNNQLTEVPGELGQLTNLQTLRLDYNQLTQVPEELGRLTNLQKLRLDYNQLTQVPEELGQLTDLQWLDLNNNQLTEVPGELGQLTNLQTLRLDYNQLTQMPGELSRLSNLQILHFDSNQLTTVPEELGRLTNLQELYLDFNQLAAVPRELGELTKLQWLYLNSNQLTATPGELGRLTKLRTLYLYSNQLTHLPPELGQLSSLLTLSLHSNQLTHLPPELGQLSSLQELYLDSNQLTHLPPELGQLTNLQFLSVEDNPPIRTLPPEIIVQSTAAMLGFLRELLEHSLTRYEAKLLLVGEGGTGKSSLLRALRNQRFELGLSTTHGIEVDSLVLPHPQLAQIDITLNSWDFGGQQIYHATHQFFLTRRSLYLVTWNARLGVEQGRLHYWLETIKALAPDAPVLLVATHIDERPPDLNFAALKEEFPQLVGQVSVSNKLSTGITTLKETLAEIAAQLPIMGQPWPQKWLQVEERLLARPEHHINVATYVQCCADCGVDEALARGTLGSYLHDLGKILYFSDDAVLQDLVVLKPNWVTKAISLVLNDEQVRDARGILYHTELRRIWVHGDEGPYPPYLYPIFLRLMERFYLSYQIEADIPGAPSTRSLIPQLLPHEPPLTLPPWPSSPPTGQTSVEMRYHLSFVPAGIMSWFILRTHLYTQSQHWREGALLTYQDHYARVELHENRKEIRLLVWDMQPYTFFSILMHTLDVILAFFQGLEIRREIPCICHWQCRSDQPAEPCPHFYRYEELVRRMEARRYTIECAESFATLSVPQLLYGIHPSTDAQVMENMQTDKQVLQELQGIKHDLSALRKLDTILEKLDQQSELICRNFTRQWNYEMKKLEAECPNTFFLLPGSSRWFNPQNWVSEEYRLYLLCQHPPGPHQVGDGYTLSKAEDWWLTISPWLNHVVIFLKYAVPLSGGLEKVFDPALVKQFQDQLDLLEHITADIPHLQTLDTMKPVTTRARVVEDQQAVGPALRALHAFLKEQDANERWGGLNKTLTPDGNILWLCSDHRQQYEAKRAVI